MWWVGLPRRRAAVAAAVVLSAALSAAPAAAGTGQVPAADPSPTPETHSTLPGDGGDDGIANAVLIELDDRGVLHVQETLTFGGGAPDTFTRTFTVREPYDTAHDRVYEVSAITARDPDGAEVATSTADHGATLDVGITPGDATTVLLEYEVRGAMDTVGSSVELDWDVVAGYSAPVAETTVVVDAGVPPQALSCTAGAPRSSLYCTSSDMGGHQALLARFLQNDMAVGDRLGIVVGYPAGTAPGDPVLDRTWSLTSAFAITPATTAVFGLVLAVLIGGLIALIRIRGRDERALRTQATFGDSAPLTPGGGPGALRFRPPDGVHPGQIGTLIDEQADVVDITATVVDLAVRGHLTIRELPHAGYSAIDWRLDKCPGPVDDELLPYERMLLDALFHSWHQVKLSELGRSDFPTRLSEVRDELYRDMVRLKWFANRPNVERNRWASAGIALTVAGVVLTVVLAVFTQAAFTGLAVVIAGAAVTVGAQYVPAKTRQGSVVFAHTLGFRAYLLGADAEHVPQGHRVHLFSRYLPYAIIFDNVDRWAAILSTAGRDELDEHSLPWYVGPDDWRLEDFTDSITAFTLTLTGVISNTRQFRALD
ncbi:DUF2207 domain-containing protein [Nocardiopsis trehalosi]|uniref:DUF2207 domain-containing protein n=1 Tax=Nocardiopsis trehalosi TaxID=109329 RepID=UPI0008333EDC|nr:DUF2207 domain-containing protein [Nocardiopsis trehalosi]